MAVTPSRLIARKTLTEVRTKGTYVTKALSKVLEGGDYSAKDIGYGSRLAHLSVGTYRATSDILSRYLSKPAKLPPAAHDALVVAATELIYLNAPVYTVDQGVALMRESFPEFAPIANAVLRKVSNLRADIVHMNPGFAFGFPDWLANYLIDENGKVLASQIMKVSNEEAPIYGYVLSVAPADWEEQLTGAGAQITALKDNAIFITDMHAIRNDPLIRERKVLITDRGAQISVGLAPLGARMLEVGCGRGTKSLILADRARRAENDADCTIIGIDRDERKIERARHDAEGLGFSEITYQVADATELDEFSKACGAELFDTVFVDAPCSGLGTLRRRADKRMTLLRVDISDMARLSARILANASRMVAEDGTLVYATCTISKQENAGVVDGFLASEEGAAFVVDPIRAEELPEAMQGSITEAGYMQLLPTSGGADGHFVARMKRRSD